MSEEKIQEREEPQEEQKVFPDDYWQYDKEGAYKTITNVAEHIKKGYALADEVPVAPFSNIVLSGMGGSGIAGDLLKTFLDLQADFPHLVETTKGYEAPKSVTKNTLYIAISYSGNTEETLSNYKTAARKGCQAILISNGGKLEELAKLNKHHHIKLPKGLQPRMAIAYLFFPLIKLLENAQAIPSQATEIKKLADTLQRQDLSKKAIELSEKCFEKNVVTYADQSFYPVAYRWKTQFNENAKTTAFSHAFSEMNHNELLAYSNRVGGFHCFLLSTDKEHRRVIKRMHLAKEIFQKKGVSVTEINIKGPLLHQMFTTILLGDLISYFLALRYETDPTPVVLIEQFKKDLGPFLI